MAGGNIHASDAKHAVEQAEVAAQRAADHPWFGYLARYGYAAKGTVYLLAGALSARAAFGLGGQTADKAAALQTLLAEPFGKILILLIGIGLIGYVLLRLVQALLDAEGKGSDAKGYAARAGYFASAVVYAALALTAFRLALSAGASGGDGSPGLVARVFSYPLGRWLVGLAGLVIIGAGAQQLYRGWKGDFSEHISWDAMSALERTWVTRLGRAGLIARGVVWAVTGWLVLQAALMFNPQRAAGSEGALQTLAGGFGPWAMGVVAIGLVAYGIYMLAAARYSRIVTH